MLWFIRSTVFGAALWVSALDWWTWGALMALYSYVEILDVVRRAELLRADRLARAAFMAATKAPEAPAQEA